MNLPPGVEFQPERKLVIWRPQGLLNEQVVNKILAFIGEEEAESNQNELRFTDTTGLTEIDLNFRYVFHIGLYRRLSRQGRQSLRSAFLIRNDAFAHYFKLHALLTDHSSLQVKLFEDLEAAARWLDVPAESLRMPAASS